MSPPRQQEDKAFVTSFGYYLGARKLRERTAVYDNVKMVIFKSWVLGWEFCTNIGTNDSEMDDELSEFYSVYHLWPLILAAVATGLIRCLASLNISAMLAHLVNEPQ